MAVIPSWAGAYAGRVVVVTGAGGFIGSRVARRLAAAGARVLTVVRPGATPLVDHMPADLATPGTAAAAIRRAQPSITFNLAGYGVDPAERDTGLAARINSDLVEELVAACAALPADDWGGLRLVHAGSALEYGTAGGDLVETTPPSPTTLYGQTKLAGTRTLEAAAAAGAIRGVTARLFTVYGPGEHPGRLLPTLLRATRHQDPVPLTAGSQRRDFAHVDDVAEGMLRLGVVAGHCPAVVNLATGTLETVRHFAERAAAVLGIAAGRLHFGAFPARPEEMAHEPVNIARLVALTGWRPATPIEEGVRLTWAEEGGATPSR